MIAHFSGQGMLALGRNIAHVGQLLVNAPLLCKPV